MITFKHKGSFKKTDRFLTRVLRLDYRSILESYAKKGVSELANNTPVDSGLTSQSWDYIIKYRKDTATITWTNSNVVDGVPIAIILQYGHGSRNGAYVQGRDYINPQMQPIFDELSKTLWKEVTTL